MARRKEKSFRELENSKVRIFGNTSSLSGNIWPILYHFIGTILALNAENREIVDAMVNTYRADM